MIFKDKIRWFFLLPMSIMSLVIVYFIAGILKPYIEQHHLLSTLFFQVALGCLASFISAFLFVGVGSLFAPTHQFQVARILTITFLVLSVFKIIDLLRVNENLRIPWIYIGLATIAGVSGAFLMLSLLVQKKNQ